MDNMKNSPVYFEDQDFCNVCCNKHALELYDIYGKSIGYTLLLRQPENTKRIVDTKNPLSHFKCRHCGTVFGIGWSFRDKWFPIPFKEGYRLQNFAKNFLQREDD